jgi:hypothetical protein
MLADLPPDAPVLGVRFRPGRAPDFLGGSAEALLNADVPLRDLWGDSADRLSDALERAPTVTAGLRAIEQAVEQQRRQATDQLVAAAVAQLRRTPDTHVRALGDTLGISERQLLRRFATAVGYGPKVLARVLRFQRFMRLIDQPGTRHVGPGTSGCRPAMPTTPT